MMHNRELAMLKYFIYFFFASTDPCTRQVRHGTTTLCIHMDNEPYLKFLYLFIALLMPRMKRFAVQSWQIWKGAQREDEEGRLILQKPGIKTRPDSRQESRLFVKRESCVPFCCPSIDTGLVSSTQLQAACDASLYKLYLPFSALETLSTI